MFKWLNSKSAVLQSFNSAVSEKWYYAVSKNLVLGERIPILLGYNWNFAIEYQYLLVNHNWYFATFWWATIDTSQWLTRRMMSWWCRPCWRNKRDNICTGEYQAAACWSQRHFLQCWMTCILQLIWSYTFLHINSKSVSSHSHSRGPFAQPYFYSSGESCDDHVMLQE